MLFDKLRLISWWEIATITSVVSMLINQLVIANWFGVTHKDTANQLPPVYLDKVLLSHN